MKVIEIPTYTDEVVFEMLDDIRSQKSDLDEYLHGLDYKHNGKYIKKYVNAYIYR